MIIFVILLTVVFIIIYSKNIKNYIYSNRKPMYIITKRNNYFIPYKYSGWLMNYEAIEKNSSGHFQLWSLEEAIMKKCVYVTEEEAKEVIRGLKEYLKEEKAYSEVKND